MKKLLILLTFIPILLNAYIADLQYDRNIVEGSLNISSLLCHNNKLYATHTGFIGEYNIDESGDIELNKQITNYYWNSPIIIGDSLYISDLGTEVVPLSDETRYFKSFTLSGENIEYSDSITTDNLISKYEGNNDCMFIYYYDTSGGLSEVYNRHNFEHLTTVETGIHFSIKDTLLFAEMVQGDQSALSIRNIKDINNVYEIAFLETGNYQQNKVYYFDNTTLFITRETEILIIDFSDPHQPQLLSKITNIPQFDNVIYMYNILKWNNYLLFASSANKIWVYNVSNPENPTFLNCYSNDRFTGNLENGFAKNDDYIYYAGNHYDIFKIDPVNLPDINILNSYNIGEQYYIDKNNFIDDKLLIVKNDDINNYATLSYDINSSDEPVHVTGIGNYVLNSIKTDSLFIGVYRRNNTQKIALFRYEDNEFIRKDSISFVSQYSYKYYDYKNHILVIMDTHGGFKFYNISNNYRLQYLYSINTIGRFYFIPQTSNFSLNYFYFSYHDENYTLFLSIRETEYPFDEVYNGRLMVNSHYEDYIMLLSNDKVILLKGSNNLITYKLCNYAFPDSFELLDTKITDQYLRLHDNYLIGIKNSYGRTVHYYTWANDEIEEVYSYDFGYPIADNIFLPEQNKLIAIGLYEINVYDCEYVSVENNEITNIYPINISNYPNPFNPSTTISFNSAKAERDTKVVIYNLKGEKVKEISVTNCKQGENKIVWNGKNDNNKKVTSGVYLYQLKQNGKTVATKKMIMVK